MFFHTRYRAFGPEPIQVYSQPAGEAAITFRQAASVAFTRWCQPYIHGSTHPISAHYLFMDHAAATKVFDVQ